MKKKIIYLHVAHRYSIISYKRITDLISKKHIKFKFLIGNELIKEKAIVKFLKKTKTEFQIFPNVRKKFNELYF